MTSIATARGGGDTNMSLLMDLLKSVFEGAIHIFVVKSGGRSDTRQLWVARIVASAVIVGSAAVIWGLSSPVRWVGVVTGLLAVAYGFAAELKHR